MTYLYTCQTLITIVCISAIIAITADTRILAEGCVGLATMA